MVAGTTLPYLSAQMRQSATKTLFRVRHGIGQVPCSNPACLAVPFSSAAPCRLRTPFDNAFQDNRVVQHEPLASLPSTEKPLSEEQVRRARDMERIEQRAMRLSSSDRDRDILDPVVEPNRKPKANWYELPKPQKPASQPLASLVSATPDKSENRPASTTSERPSERYKAPPDKSGTLSSFLSLHQPQNGSEPDLPDSLQQDQRGRENGRKKLAGSAVLDKFELQFRNPPQASRTPIREHNRDSPIPENGRSRLTGLRPAAPAPFATNALPIPETSYDDYPRSSNIEIPQPNLPSQVQRHYASESWVCFERSAGPGSPVALQPPPPPVDLCVAHELFGCYKPEHRFGRLMYVRSETGIPDIALCGRVGVGKTALIGLVGAAALSEHQGKVDDSYTALQAMTPPDTFAVGFRPLVHDDWKGNSISCRVRLLDSAGLGHWHTRHMYHKELGLMMRKRRNTRGAVLVVSAVAGPHEHDPYMIQTFVDRGIPFTVALVHSHPYVPSLTNMEDRFPPQVWSQLLETVGKVLDMIEAEGASHLHCGLHAVGNTTFHDKPLGILGLKYAMARMCGFIKASTQEHDRWTRLDLKSGEPTMPKLDPLTAAELPISSSLHTITADRTEPRRRAPRPTTRLQNIYNQRNEEHRQAIMRLYGGALRSFAKHTGKFKMEAIPNVLTTVMRKIFSRSDMHSMVVLTDPEIRDLVTELGGIVEVLTDVTDKTFRERAKPGSILHFYHPRE